MVVVVCQGLGGLNRVVLRMVELPGMLVVVVVVVVWSRGVAHGMDVRSRGRGRRVPVGRIRRWGHPEVVGVGPVIGRRGVGRELRGELVVVARGDGGLGHSQNGF